MKKKKKKLLNKKDNIKKNRDPIENYLKYFEFRDEENRYWKFSLYIYHSNTGTACYRCYDTSCKSRGTINIYAQANDPTYKFCVKTNHSITYELHTYIRLESVRKDLDNLSIIQKKKN